MWTLAIDTSTTVGSLAIACTDTTPLGREWRREKSHSEWITTTLQDLLKEAQISSSDLKRVIVSVGPGSFTGLRVGVNLAKTLAYSHSSIKLYGISSLRVLAEPGKHQKQPILSAMNAFKNLMYVARYQSNGNGSSLTTITEPRAVTAQDLSLMLKTDHWCAGDAMDGFFDQLDPKARSLVHRHGPVFPQAKDLLQIAFKDLGAASPEAWISIKPLYIRASEAEEKLKAGLLKPLPKL